MNYFYLAVNLGAVAVPLAFSFHPRIQFYKQWKSAWPAFLLPLLLFLPWDMLFTHWKVWGFNDRYITGLNIGNIPVEEVMFFLCIPYACLFTYYSLSLAWIKNRQENNKSFLPYILGAVLIIIGLVNITKWYTASTFLLAGIFQFIAAGYLKGKIIHFYKTYLVLLIPFFIVNGLLTGTGIDQEVVWYNNGENLGIRLLTIPIEDIFYGMLLVQMNVFFFEWLRVRQSAPKQVYSPRNRNMVPGVKPAS